MLESESVVRAKFFSRTYLKFGPRNFFDVIFGGKKSAEVGKWIELVNFLPS